MSRFISDEALARLREEYQAGFRVELVKMNDPHAPPIGTKGTVVGVDDIGSVMVRWDNGCGLSVAWGEDVCKVIHETVEAFLKDHSDAVVHMMTPGGYVDLGPTDIRALLGGGAVESHLGARGTEHFIPANEILQFLVYTCSYHNSAFYILAEVAS